MKLLLIDHGLSFPNGTDDQGWGGSGKRFPGPLEYLSISGASRKRWPASLRMRGKSAPSWRTGWSRAPSAYLYPRSCY